jgi:hypothetical protein
MYTDIKAPTDATHIVVLACCEVVEVLAVLRGDQFEEAKRITEAAVAEYLNEYVDDDLEKGCAYLVEGCLTSFDIDQAIVERLFYDGSEHSIQINFYMGDL